MYKNQNYETMTNQELLGLVIRERQGENVSETLFNEFANLPSLLVDSDLNELLKFKGIGITRANQIKAVFELGKRLYENEHSVRSSVKSPADAANIMMASMRFLKKEHFKTIQLDIKCNVISIETISIGSINSSIVHPREVFNPAIKKSAASIIGIHNHPSGDPSPSNEDITITKRLVECGKLLGIELVDHVIIGDGRYVSLKERNVI
jgi:DNA repair protein RadC